MNIRFANDAAGQLDMMRMAAIPQSGFIIGDTIGKFIIVRNFVSVPLDSGHIDELYSEALGKFGAYLQGVFFIGCEPGSDDWFCEDLVMVANHGRLEFFMCRACSGTQRMQQILDWEED